MRSNNLGIVVAFEVIRTLTKRRFWIATLIVPAAVGVVIALVVGSNMATQSRVESQANAEFSFTYSDASGYVDPAVVAALGGVRATDSAQAIADVRSGRTDAYFAYPSDPTKESTKVYGVDAGVFENDKYSAVAEYILVASAQDRIGDATLATLAQGDFPIASVAYKDGQEAGGVYGVIPPLVYLAVFFAAILLLGNQMTSSLLEEKENRVTEIILTTMDPTVLVVGKVVSLFIVGMVQMLVFVLPAAIAYRFFGDALDLPSIDLSQLVLDPAQMIVGALLLLGGFTLFTATLVAVGAIMPTASDAGQIAGPTMVLLFAPLWIVSLVISDPSSFIVQVFTYFPYTAPVTAMLRNGLGSLGSIEATIVITELFVLGVLVLRMGIRVFRYGSIEYSRKVSLRAVFAAKK